MTKVSPLAPGHFPVMPEVSGVHMHAESIGVKYQGRKDLAVFALAPGTKVAGVFTRSTMPGAPVVFGRKSLKACPEDARVLVVNSGNANAFTGDVGLDHVEQTQQAAAEKYNCNKDQVFVSSTGVIGEYLPIERIVAGIVNPESKLLRAGWKDTASAIMTTDTFAKGATRSCRIGDSKIVLNGIAKGSGMIAPNMATMLVYIFTDAAITDDVLQQLLKQCNERTFNSITVDSDTSTSDTVLLFATGQAENPLIKTIEDPRLAEFKACLYELMLDLAHQVIRDGEGASKFIEVNVFGAENDQAAKHVAMSVANSPLLKTAIAGEDPNWGRVIMAIGKSAASVNRKALAIRFGDISVVSQGVRDMTYVEAEAKAYLKQQEITIDIDLGVDAGQWQVWTCDLTHEYISINADYRS